MTPQKRRGVWLRLMAFVAMEAVGVYLVWTRLTEKTVWMLVPLAVMVLSALTIAGCFVYLLVWSRRCGGTAE